MTGVFGYRRKRKIAKNRRPKSTTLIATTILNVGILVLETWCQGRGRVTRNWFATKGAGSAIPTGVYLDFRDAIKRDGRNVIAGKYGTHMYAKITGEDPYSSPMRIYPAVHYTMGGLWVDYGLMSNLRSLLSRVRRIFPITALGASALDAGIE